MFEVKDGWDFISHLSWLDEYMMGHKGFIAGGCFKNIFNKEVTKDLDMFFESEADFVEAEQYYKGNEDYYIYYENSKVVAFKNRIKPHITIELIRTVFGTPEEILSKFDFSITKFAYFKAIEEDAGEDADGTITVYKCMYQKDFFEHLHLKRLVVEENILFPVSTFERMLRYAKYGYFPCKESKRRIIENLRNNVVEGDNISQSLYNGLD
ncbi:MAG TPA: hypothetical protein VN549_06175 [Negativicutes bacterium]|nr:hypothetical protein [Negativicutes bacterium]